MAESVVSVDGGRDSIVVHVFPRASPWGVVGSVVFLGLLAFVFLPAGVVLLAQEWGRPAMLFACAWLALPSVLIVALVHGLVWHEYGVEQWTLYDDRLEFERRYGSRTSRVKSCERRAIARVGIAERRYRRRGGYTHVSRRVLVDDGRELRGWAQLSNSDAPRLRTVLEQWYAGKLRT